MKKTIRLLQFISILFFFAFLFNPTACSKGESRKEGKESHNLFEEIDNEIEKAELYETEKQQRIDLLKSQYLKEPDLKRKAEVGNLLIEEYESFISDSALRYVNLNLENPEVVKDEKKTFKLRIKKADITAHAGLFGESLAILASIPANRLDTTLLRDYYYAYCDLYQYQCEYTTDGLYAQENALLRDLYTDSVTRISEPSSLVYVVNKAANLINKGQTSEAEQLLLGKIGEYKSGERNYSILASILAYDYKTTGQTDLYKHYLAESVISDLRGSIKENMAIRELATICYEEGDIERADRYLRQSFADANFYAARMRNAQSSRMLPVIGEAYNQQQKQLNRELRGFVIAISILAGVLIVIIVFTVLQVLKVKKAKRDADKMLEEVSRLSERLKAMNEEVVEANNQLKISNHIKEEYAALFMQYSSLAISNLQQYQQSLRVLAAQGNSKSLIKKIDSTDFENKVLAEFYEKFDDAILSIFPDFIEKLNSLLQPQYQISIRKGESLPTELRIYALIRIGIQDNEKIARFLRCSISTIYTYRSKTKKKAIEPETFESKIRDMGS